MRGLAGKPTAFFTPRGTGMFIWIRIYAGHLRWRIIAAIILLVGVGTTLDAQTLQVTSNGTSVSSGDTLKIDQTPSMPPLTLDLTGCDTGSYTMQINWSAASGQGTFASTSGNLTCDQSQNIDLATALGGFAGGTATIQWSSTDSCGNPLPSGTFIFKIIGTNPLPPAIDAMASSPWFFENIIAWESKYRQFDASGFPLNCNCPNGIGLTQLDPPFGINDFWKWPTNVTDGLSVLNGKQAGAYSSWNSELGQMQQTTGGNPVYPPPTSYSYCSFQYPQNGGDTYADGDWIHRYNGGDFIFWNPPNPTTHAPGFWDIDTNGYVSNVCNSAAQ